MVEELQENLKMRDVFSQSTGTDTSDATLMWQGRNRFLAKNASPVSICRKDEHSYPEGGGEHGIIDGDNLAVMRSLLTEISTSSGQVIGRSSVAISAVR